MTVPSTGHFRAVGASISTAMIIAGVVFSPFVAGDDICLFQFVGTAMLVALGTLGLLLSVVLK